MVEHYLYHMFTSQISLLYRHFLVTAYIMVCSSTCHSLVLGTAPLCIRDVGFLPPLQGTKEDPAEVADRC